MKHLIILFGVLFIFSCNPEQGKTTNKEEGVQKEVAEVHEGEKLMQQQCYACHNPNTSMDNLIAPPFAGIRRQYLKDNPSQDEFTNDMLKFINNPTKENAKISRAVERFGVMPKMIYKEEDIVKISDFLYNNEPEKPDWFEAHYEEHHGNNKDVENAKADNDQAEGYLSKGKKMALQTKQVLGKNLINALNTKGTIHAMQFCSTRAMPLTLTDSMSIALSNRVKRVSDNNRNPKNAANASELDYIQKAKAQIANGESPSPQMQRVGDKHVGYYPIITNQMCLQCHGIPNEQVKPATLKLINELYPDDKALGYGENELRGIFVVEMD